MMASTDEGLSSLQHTHPNFCVFVSLLSFVRMSILGDLHFFYWPGVGGLVWSILYS